MKIMSPDWIKDVWNSSCTADVLATDDVFKRHELPPFFKVRFTSTGLSVPTRTEIKELIETHGGSYAGNFSSRQIDILVLEPSSIGSAKHKAAANNRIFSVTPDWVRDSARNGYAVSMEPYKVMSEPRALLHSTPSKDVTTDFEMTDSSMVSRIVGEDLTINETVMSNASDIAYAGRRSIENPYKDALNKLNTEAAKKAGPFLDGCNVSRGRFHFRHPFILTDIYSVIRPFILSQIYVCGFANDEKEKIFQILNRGGATRYETIHANISHIIVGVPSKHELGLITATQTVLVKTGLAFVQPGLHFISY